MSLQYRGYTNCAILLYYTILFHAMLCKTRDYSRLDYDAMLCYAKLCDAMLQNDTIRYYTLPYHNSHNMVHVVLPLVLLQPSRLQARRWP